jgi:hypothetical protein
VTGPRFFAEALAEYEDAVVYYEKREEGLGARLIQEFDEAVALAVLATGWKGSTSWGAESVAVRLP